MTQVNGASQAQNAAAIPNTGLAVEGNKITTPGGYEIEFKKDEVVVTDPNTGKWFKAWGDPHFATSDDGHVGEFHDENLTIDLPDGTKITFDVTDTPGDGPEWIDNFAVMNGTQGVVVEGVHSGELKVGDIQGANKVDAMWQDGTVLQVGAEIDDLFMAGGEELVKNGAPTTLDGKGGVSDTTFLTQEAENGPYGGLWKAAGGLQSQINELEADIANFDTENGDELELQQMMQQLQTKRALQQSLIQMISQLIAQDNQTRASIVQNIGR